MITIASKFWISLCLVLFAYNLISLINECYSVNYKIVEKDDRLFDEDGDTIFLFCTPFGLIKQNNHLGHQPAIKDVPVKSFLRYAIASIENRLNANNLFRLNQSHIFNNHVCFTIHKTELEKELNHLNWFLNIYFFQNIFIYSNGKQPFFYEVAFQKLDFLPSVYFRAYKKKVFNRNPLLNSDCLNRKNQIEYNKGKCFDKCLVKLKIKTSFYNFDDSELFDLNEISNGGALVQQNMNQESIIKRKKIKNCLEQCKETDCFCFCF